MSPLLPKRWLGVREKTPVEPVSFSLRALRERNAALARRFLWSTNAMPVAGSPIWLHLGCGERVFDGFVNVDFIPHDERVLAWDLLDVWPETSAGKVAGVFSEDVLEHFFRDEQIYILCNVNRALATGGVARTLMPSLSKLVALGADYRPAPDELLHAAFGVDTGADAVNMGMRFSGHRWLHDDASLAHMADLCGFDATATACATSTVSRFDGLNLRDESNSLSFATDLRKRSSIDRVAVPPQRVEGATLAESVGGIALYRATADRPRVSYALPRTVAVDDVCCINIRSANASSFDEHSLKTLVLDDANASRPWSYDETMKSRPCMNLAARSEIAIMLGQRRTFSILHFSPAARAGEYFTLGDAELFTRAA
jgi:hypothetical protein